jgi:hypothetical protein
MSNDKVIEYIKDSLDQLHVKVDTIHKDADIRIKSLEDTRSQQKGAMAALSFIGALIGSVITLASGYLFLKD